MDTNTLYGAESPAQEFLLSLPIVRYEDLPENYQSCHICHELFDDPAVEENIEFPVRLPCNHVLGSDCLTIWFGHNNSCPMCRAVLFENSVPSARPSANFLGLPPASADLSGLPEQELIDIQLLCYRVISAGLHARLVELEAAEATEENRAEIDRITDRLNEINAEIVRVGYRIQELEDN